jgi:uncharacterized membrane protein YfcA
MSGGGQSAINVPVLLWLGVSFPLATLTQKISSVFWTPLAAYNYLKDRKIDWKFLIVFSLVGLAGVYFGTLFIVYINQKILELVIGSLILFLVLLTIYRKEIGLTEEKKYSKFRQRLAYVFSPILGFYEGIFGAGNGILFPMVTFFTRGFDFVDALGYYYLASFSWCLFASILLIAKGYFSFAVVAPVVLGSIIGGYTGSRYAKYKGNKFIKMMFVLVGTLLAIKLLMGL